MSFKYSEILEKLINRSDLSIEESHWLMEETMTGNLTPTQISGWLIALRMKGETSSEISSFAGVMREKAVQVNSVEHPVIDTCGTGGDKSSLINVSTLSALILSNRGVRVAKHGNRSVSSSSGAADILEKLGYDLSQSPEEVSERINKKKFGFFFAPSFHPAMKYAGPVRKDLGVRTIFNILGPLANPARAEIHLMGVFNKNLISQMGEALKNLGAKTFLVVHSKDGLDEISPLMPTSYLLYHNGSFKEGEFDPKVLNFSIKNLDELKVRNPEDALERAKLIIEGKDNSGAEIVALNTAAAEYLWELHSNKTSLDLSSFLEERTKDILENIKSGNYTYSSVL